jgi:hypothetical protein
VRSLRSLSKPFILFQRYTPAVHIIAHQNTRVNIARPFSGTGNVCGDRVLCLNIELSIAVAAPRVRFPFLFIVLFPEPLHSLVRFDGDRRWSDFMRLIRHYNSLFAFASTGVYVDQSINTGSDPYVF